MGSARQDRVASVGPPGREPLGAARTTLLAVYCMVGVAYFGWRGGTLDPDYPAFSLALLAAESCGAAGLLLQLFVTRRLAVRTDAPAPAGLSVDVFVTVRDQPVDMLRRTLIAARSMDYPHQTWLVDEGRRPEARLLAAELRIHYLERPLDARSRAESLNFALRHSQAAFLALFDAHDAPARNFLAETLGHFRDPCTAFVQTPLDAYNLDSFVHRRNRRGLVVWNDLTLFSRVLQRGKDCDNAVQLCGSCAILRRTALDQIGGFAAATAAPALHTSLRFHKAGWRSAYHARTLAFGMAPVSVGPFVDRYLRRGQGAMQVWRRERILLSGRLSVAQKAAYLHTFVGYFVGWRKSVYYLTPVVILTTGALPFAGPVAEFTAAFAAFHLLGFWVQEEAGRGHANVLRAEQYHLLRFAASIAATLTGPPRFIAAGPPRSASAGHARRNPAGIWPFVLPQGALLFACALAIPAGVALHARGGLLAHDALVAAAAWAGLNGALAAAVLSFTARVAAFRRRDYRFRVPIPARLHFADDSPMLGIFDDVSSSGFKFYGPFPPRVGIGTRFTGDLFLPSGTTPFTAIVRAGVVAPGDGHVKGIGCSFEWAVPAGRDALERYLYGTDLQWTLNALQDRIPTPLERLRNAFSRAPRAAPPPHWAPVLYQHAANTLVPPQVGFVSLPAGDIGDRRLATLEPLDPKLPVRLRIVTRTGSRSMVGQAVDVLRVETAANPVFLYRLAS